jgi:hypothetical protein
MTSTTCSEVNDPIIKKLLEDGHMALCPYTVGFVDACLMGADYHLLINYFGVNLCEKVLIILEEQEKFEDCALLKDCIDNYDAESDYYY